jgi:F0F1-type ATP synthase delta subunit
MKNAKAIAETIIASLQENGEYESLSEIVSHLEKELFRSQVITVVSAQPLGKTEAEELKKKLTEKWGEHEIAMSVDPDILSGMIVRFQSQVIDMSGIHSLQQLKTALT